jgi:hypothetical protein
MRTRAFWLNIYVSIITAIAIMLYQIGEFLVDMAGKF